MVEKIKANEPLYRALRTFLQTFLGTFASALVVSGTEDLTKKTIITLIGSALASALSAVMNMSKEENPESVEEVD